MNTVPITLTGSIAEQQERCAAMVDIAVRCAHREISEIRNDHARPSNEWDQVSRALIRQHVNGELVGLGAQRNDSADALAPNVINEIARGLGFRSDSQGSVQSGLTRNDASNLFAGEGIADDGAVIGPEYRRRVLTSALPKRSVPAGAQAYRTRFAAHEGSAAVYREGMTEIPMSGSSVGSTLRQLTTIVTGTSTPVSSILSGYQSPSKASEDAAAASNVLMDTMENILVGGIPGLDFISLSTLPVYIYPSAVNYGTETNMDTLFADLIAMVQSIVIANDDVGEGPRTLLMGTRWLRALQKRSNFNAGGNSTGSEVLAALMGMDAMVGQALRNAGITSVIGAPSLNGRGPAGPAAAYDSALLFDGDPEGLRVPLALPPSPIATITQGLDTVTVWAAQFGSLEAPRAYNVGRAYARVA